MAISKRKEIFYSIWIMLCGACGPRIKMQESQLVNTDSRVGILDRVGQLALEKSECKTQNNRLLHDSCIPVSQSWKKNDFNWYTSDSITLIMEPQMPTSFTLGRYKNRMRDILELKPDGTYTTSEDPGVTLSNALVEIFEITGRRDPYFSAESLGKMGINFEEIFKDDFENLEFGHGTVAFSVIGEYVPSSGFVYAPPPLPPASILCAKKWSDLDKYFDKALTSFSSKLIENDVSVVNISGGDDRPTIRKYFEGICPGGQLSRSEEDLYLSAASNFYFGLKNSAKIIVLQSAVGMQNVVDFPIDCPSESIKNRLRVHFILDASDTILPRLGASVHDGFDYLFGSERFPDKECTDVYFKPGTDNRRKYSKISLSYGTNFFFDKLDYIYTSFITPLASAFILSQRNTLFKDMNGEQIAKKMLEPGFPSLYDPFGNRQLEAYEKDILGNEQ